jgi:hypothetical protein
MFDLNLIETIRTKYQLDMKKSVVMLSRMLKDDYNGTNDILEDIDNQLKVFSEAKERATHFETIIKTLINENGEAKND